MDILSLAITGAVGQLTKEIIHESYMVLRNSIIQKYGQHSRIAQILQKIEASPTSDRYRKDLVNEIKVLKAFEDGEIVALAQILQKSSIRI